MELQYLIDTYQYEAYPKRRHNAERVMFDTHWERNIYNLYCAINERHLQPTAYTFVVLHPKPREVFACDISTQICQYYLDSQIKPLVEKELIDTTFSNRVGMGNMAAVDNLISDIYEVSQGFTNPDCWIIKLDMQGYFPNANQDVAYRQLSDVVLRRYKGDNVDEILFLLQRCIYSCPANHCDRKSPNFDWSLIDKSKSLFNKPEGVGGAIGFLIWQLAMIYYINDITRWLSEDCGLHITVYMDDIAIVTDNKEATLGLIPELRQRLAALGVMLHPRKFYCQHYTKGVEFLGFHVKMDRLYLNKRTLRNAHIRIRKLNHAIRAKNIDSMVSTVNSYLGLCKNCNGFSQACALLKAIDKRWWRFVEYDNRRICVHPREVYKNRNKLITRYNLQHYDRNRKKDRNLSKRKINY